MHQPHFLLSAAARSLSAREIFGLSDERAVELLRGYIMPCRPGSRDTSRHLTFA